MQTDVTAHADLISILTKLSNVFSSFLLLSISLILHSVFVWRSIVFHKSTHTHIYTKWEAFKLTLHSCRFVAVVVSFFLLFCNTIHKAFVRIVIFKCTGTITFGDVQKLNNISWLLFPSSIIHVNVCDCKLPECEYGLELPTMSVSNCGKPTSPIRFANSKKMKDTK